MGDDHLSCYCPCSLRSIVELRENGWKESQHYAWANSYHYREGDKLSVCLYSFVAFYSSQQLSHYDAYGISYSKEGHIEKVTYGGEYIAACNCI